MRVVLFDIDGTLLTAAGVGRIALRRTLIKVLGDGTAADTAALSGRVDWGIWREVMGNAGYSTDEVDAQIGDYLRLFVAELAAVMAEPDLPKPRLLPGVTPLLEALRQDEKILIGLVTGNSETAAWLKLGYAGIAPYFWFGAFGNEAWERNALPAIALERASRFAEGRLFTGADTVIIGDSIHDVACAKTIGATVIGVPTGIESADALALAGADVVLPTLEDTDAVLRIIRNL
jgi:phosphoglycolate phosphatase